MNPPADIIRKLLIDYTLATASGAWPVFTSFLPADPDEAVCVFDTAGKTDGRLMPTGENIGHPGIQIRIRAKAYPAAWRKAYDIAKDLDSVRRVLVVLSDGNEYTVHNVSRSGSLIPLGVEQEGDRRRYHFSVNATLTLSEKVDGVWVPFVVAGGTPFYVQG